jgi:hypothetical protein
MSEGWTRAGCCLSCSEECDADPGAVNARCGSCGAPTVIGSTLRLQLARGGRGMDKQEVATLKAEYPEVPPWMLQRGYTLEQARELMALRRRAFPKSSKGR